MADGDCKTCARCGESKPKTEFGKSKREKDGLRGNCKACRKIEQRDYYERNRDKVLAKNARWFENNPDARRAIGRRWQQQWRERDPEGYRAAQAESRDKENLRSWQLRYWDKNREKIRANVRAYSARKRGADGQHTLEDIQRLFTLQKGRCAYCRNRLPKSYHVDHRQPLARGGSNWPSNLQLLCPKCNHSKGAKPPEEFAQRLGLLL